MINGVDKPLLFLGFPLRCAFALNSTGRTDLVFAAFLFDGDWHDNSFRILVICFITIASVIFSVHTYLFSFIHQSQNLSMGMAGLLKHGLHPVSTLIL